MQAIGIIPARLQSSRLPQKLLLSQTGKTLIQHTWEAALNAGSLHDVIIATDSLEIMDEVQHFGGKCELTGEHASGTDRIAEVVRRLGLARTYNAVVNIQGDEPEIEAEHIETLVELLAANPRSEMSTLATRIDRVEQLDDPSCTKLVRTTGGQAMYFSRLPIPYCRDQQPQEIIDANDTDSPWLLHLGIYAFRPDFLLQLTQLSPSPLEQLEKLEQLRALQAGATIEVACVDQATVGIDTPDDYAQFVARQRRRAA